MNKWRKAYSFNLSPRGDDRDGTPQYSSSQSELWVDVNTRRVACRVEAEALLIRFERIIAEFQQAVEDLRGKKG